MGTWSPQRTPLPVIAGRIDWAHRQLAEQAAAAAAEPDQPSLLDELAG